MRGLLKIGRADQLSVSHRNILKWTKTLEASLAEQQRIYLKERSLDKNKIGYYIASIKCEELASLCVIHIMRHLLGEFLHNTNKDADRSSQVRDLEIDPSTVNVKLPALKLFADLGRLVDRQLKHQIINDQK